MGPRTSSPFWRKLGCLLPPLLFVPSVSEEIVGYRGWDIASLTEDLSSLSNLSGFLPVCSDFDNNGILHFDMKGLITLSLRGDTSAPRLLPPLPYQMIAVNEGAKPSMVRLNCSEKDLQVVDVMANILAKENNKFAEFFDVVPVHHTFTLPASWGSRQEEIVYSAGARVNVTVDIQHRPSTASMVYTAVHAHILENGYQFEEERPQRVLVYSFDDCVSVDRVAVHEVNHFNVEVNSAPCYLTLGSIYARAESYFLNMFAKRYEVNLSQHFWAMKDFQHQFRLGLPDFLKEPTANFTVDLSAPGHGSRYQGPKFKVVASAEDFDEMFGFDEISSKLVAMTEQSLEQSTWSKKDVDMVVIAGNGLGGHPRIQQILSNYLESSKFLLVPPSTADPGGFDTGDFLETSFVVDSHRVVIDTYEDKEADLLLCKIKDTVMYMEEREERDHIVKELRHEAKTGLPSQELRDLIWQKRGARKSNLNRYSSCWKLVRPSDNPFRTHEMEVWHFLVEQGSVSSVQLGDAQVASPGEASKADEFCVPFAVVIVVAALSGAVTLGACLYYFFIRRQVQSIPAQSEGERDVAVVQEFFPAQEEITGEDYQGQQEQRPRRRNQRTRQRFNSARARALSPTKAEFD